MNSRVVSVNVGLPQVMEWRGKSFTSSIHKSPVAECLHIGKQNITGDQQADLTVHGGPDKAVYAYDLANYSYWQQQLNRPNWSFGLFGENLTTDGLPDQEVYIGNIYRVGTALLQIAQPRFPCFKLNARFDDPTMVRQFSDAKRCGLYFRVIDEGYVQTGDEIALVEEPDKTLSISNVVDVYLSRNADADLMDRLVTHPFLARKLQHHFKRFRWSIEK